MVERQITLKDSDLENVFEAFSNSFLYNLLYMGVYQQMPVPYFHHDIMEILGVLAKLPLKNKKKYVRALFQCIDSEEEAIAKVRYLLEDFYFRNNDETDAWDLCKCWALPPQMPDMERLGKAVWVLERYFTVFTAYNVVGCDCDSFWNLCCKLFMNKEELCIPFRSGKTVDFDADYSFEELKESAKRCRRYSRKSAKHILKNIRLKRPNKDRQVSMIFYQEELERLKKIDNSSLYYQNKQQKLQKMPLTAAFAQRQGRVGDFEFYTLDNEHKSHYPHIHICVKNDGKTKGTLLKDGSGLLSLGSVRLYPNENYTVDNLVFEAVHNPIITTKEVKNLIVSWLLEENNGLKVKNCFKCISDYDTSNPTYKDFEKYQGYLEGESR